MFVRLHLTSAQDNATRMEPASNELTTPAQDIHEAAQRDLPTMLSPERIHWAEEIRRANGSDETEDLVFVPDVVVEPVSTAEVSALMAWAHQHGVPVTAAGARTGLSGGALPVQGLSLIHI